MSPEAMIADIPRLKSRKLKESTNVVNGFPFFSDAGVAIWRSWRVKVRILEASYNPFGVCLLCAY